MPWGVPFSRGAGSTQEIEDAHRALDEVGIPPSGPLAVRALTAAELMRLDPDARQAALILRRPVDH